jgi:hypothetical protein
MRGSENGTMIFDAYLFALLTCNCSRRTVEMEEQYGSYCDICWEIIRKESCCFTCGISVEKERLFVNSTQKIGCFACFRQKGFPYNVITVKPGHVKPKYSRTMWPSCFHLFC